MTAVLAGVADTPSCFSTYETSVAGDWKNYFTPQVTRTFKGRYGSLLVATGYERGFNW